MDEVARFNQARWEDLARAGIQYSRPFLDLDENSAKELVDPEGFIGEVRGKDVLCLAGGGGQQSAGLGLLGANVTVVDITETQLERDVEAARHYGIEVTTVQGDMRDLSAFGADSFDIVWHAHSINFVPDAREVFRQVQRVLRDGGIYRYSCSNPYFMEVDEANWNGDGYSLKHRYVEGEVTGFDPHWTFTGTDGTPQSIRGPKEYRHSMETLVNGLVELGFVVLKVIEQADLDPEAELVPGTWDHFKSVAPPFLEFWTMYRPEVYG